MLNLIRTKIFLLFTFGLSFILLTVVAISTSEISHRYEELFIERGKNSANQLAYKTRQLLQLGLYPKEFIGYEKLCQSIIDENEGISFVALLDKKNTAIFYAGDSNDKKSFDFSDKFTIQTPLENSSNLENSILVIVNRDIIGKKTKEISKSIIVYSTIVYLIVIFLLLVYLKVNLGEPLNSLVERIKNIDLKKSSINEEWQLLKRKDEIGTVAREFEILIEKLIGSQESLSQSNVKLTQLNEELDNRVREEVKKNREKDFQLIEQSKMVALGEMTSNIAHQWRQPLSAITAGATGLKLQKEIGKLDDENLEKGLDNINKNAQKLSQTIDSFKEFLSNDKELKEVKIQDLLKVLLNIINESLKNSDINIYSSTIDKISNTNVSLVPGDFNQAIINIINNAKNALIERKISNAWIKIDIIESSDKIVVTIEDNAGGIAENILPHIFEPYFTTKHKSQGVGLGLNISYRIVTEVLKGKLYVKNSESGAKFFIEIPLY